MAVKLESSAKRYIGLSTDAKPVRPDADNDMVLPPGSTFFESDTGKIYRWDGGVWTYPTTEDYSAKRLAEAIEALTVQVKALRLGMIDAGNCREISLFDAA